MDNSQITIAICNYNTTELTNNCIAHIKQYVKNIKYTIIIFDNSDKNKFFTNFENIKIIDNTDNKYINFKEILSEFSKYGFKENSNASLKHCYTINYLITICNTKYLLLLDSDAIIINNLDFLSQLNNECIVSDIEINGELNWNMSKRYSAKTRFIPYIQLINIEEFKKNYITYFDPNRIYGGLTEQSKYYDTGASVYEDVFLKKLKYKRINFYEYIIHYGHMSWKSNDIDCIISITSYKKRILNGSLLKTLQSILLQKYNGSFKIIITLTAEEQKYLTFDIKKFININNIEILTADSDLKPHKKYFYVMQKYKKLPIITIDDDVIYDDDVIQSLIDSYKKFPNAISACRTHLMQRDINNKLLSYRKWKYQCINLVQVPLMELFATGVGGILYPPNCLNISYEMINDIQKIINADDIFLKKLEQLNNIKTVFVKCKKFPCYKEQISSKDPDSLCFKNFSSTQCDNDIYINAIELF